MRPGFLKGANYGNVFIPEDFFADNTFFIPNGVTKNYGKYSLCDLPGDTEASMRNWLETQIQWEDFVQMREFGVNFLRLPLGYWNVVDMQGNPNGPSFDAERMGRLNSIMPSFTYYREYIDKIMNWADQNGIWVLLDLHGAPGSQNGDSHTGCTVSGQFWDTDWNKLWTKNATLALAEICRAHNNCYGIELLNEPGNDLSRDSLIAYYQDVMRSVRDTGLDVPFVIMDWNFQWWHYQNKWFNLFPPSEYGQVLFDTHIYDFKDTVWEEEADWDQTQWPPVKTIANEGVPIMIGEYTLSLSQDLPYSEAQGWAQYVQDRLHQNGAMGSAMWQWKSSERQFWSMKWLGTEGGVNWAEVYGAQAEFLQ
jgi:aryl-phospho-beta-D-glucosidase BglC (GH1 family)